MLQSGQELSALLVDASTGAQNWTKLTLDEHLARGSGGAGTIWTLKQKSDPPLVAKIYNATIKNRISSNLSEGERLIPLVSHRGELMSRLPFAAWPRRILFRTANVTASEFANNLVGFTMARLDNTIPLNDFTSLDRCRPRVTPHDSRHIALTLVDQIDRLHRHPWKFVFGDLSPMNVRISLDYKHVHFIDTDSYQFHIMQQGRPYHFSTAGITEGFTSPFALEPSRVGPMPPEHDLFVVAILLFQIVMAQQDVLTVLPFSSGDVRDNDRIKAGQFPYANPTAWPVPDYALSKYNALNPDLRTAFTQTFTTRVPITAARWRTILSAPWGELRQP
jgi:DNA-binding helix-hairpin-helix protein with protein kinase domain